MSVIKEQEKRAITRAPSSNSECLKQAILRFVLVRSPWFTMGTVGTSASLVAYNGDFLKSSSPSDRLCQLGSRSNHPLLHFQLNFSYQENKPVSTGAVLFGEALPMDVGSLSPSIASCGDAVSFTLLVGSFGLFRRINHVNLSSSTA